MSHDPSNPFEAMLDEIAWEPLDAPPPEVTGPAAGLPYPTHEGFLGIGGAKLRVFRLNTGERIVDSNDLAALFGWGTSNDVADNLEAHR